MKADTDQHIPATLVDRLAKVCDLLGSEHDGERSAAAYQATKLLREHRLTWRQLVEAAGPREPIVVTIPHEPEWSPPGWRTQLQRELLSPWEANFVANLRRWGRRPSEKQQRVLNRIYRELWS